MNPNQFRVVHEGADRYHWCWPGVELRFPPQLPYIAGILNLTPDSFSDGGDCPTIHDALIRAEAMVDEGAAIIDVGGQSTAPGALPVSAEEEEARVLPLLLALRKEYASLRDGRRILISLDTDKPALAEKILGLGLADMLNDESGGDLAMARAAARHVVPLILMHRPAMAERGDLSSVLDDLAQVRAAYVKAGMQKAAIALDPGLGFGKSEDESLALLSSCRLLRELGAPVYIGASRKRFIAKFGGASPAARRLGGSLAAAIWAMNSGVSFLRVHDVKETVEALRMTAALEAGAKPAQ